MPFTVANARLLLKSVRVSPWRAAWVTVGLVSSMAIWAWWTIQMPSAASVLASAGARVARKDFVSTLRVHGVIEAERVFSVTAPRLSGEARGPLQLTRLVASGTWVEKGEIVAAFDSQAQERALAESEADYRDRQVQLDQKRGEREASLVREAGLLAMARRAVERARLDMRRNEVISQIDAEKNALALAEAEAHLESMERTAQLREASIQSELRALEIQSARTLRSREHAEANAKRLEVRSPMEGLAVAIPVFRGGSFSDVQVGDQLSPGMAFLQVVDPAQMRVRTRINQVDLERVRVGQKASVRLDAYPEASWTGELSQLGVIVAPSGLSERVRSVVALFALEGADRRLTPNLSATVDLELVRQSNALVVPRDCLWHEGGSTLVVVREGREYVRRSVSVGSVSESEVVLLSGVEAGNELKRVGPEDASEPKQRGVTEDHK